MLRFQSCLREAGLCVCAQTALAVSLGDTRLLGKKGLLHPPQGNSATTEMFVQHHAELLLQQTREPASRNAAPLRCVHVRQLVDEPSKTSRIHERRTKESIVCCLCPSCGPLEYQEWKDSHTALPITAASHSGSSIFSLGAHIE